MRARRTARSSTARESDGIKVSLFWSRANGSVIVEVRDARTEELFVIPVEPEQALDAFQHPFAYAALGFPPDGGDNAHFERAVVELKRQTLSFL